MKNKFFGLILACLSIMLQGCASSVNKVVPPDEGLSMRDAYFHYSGGDQEKRFAERKRFLQMREAVDHDYTTGLPPNPERIKHLYPQLPNPSLFMYVRPHAVGVSGAPIPAYLTRFSMYERTHFALPGESTDSIRRNAVVYAAMAEQDRELARLQAAEQARLERKEKNNQHRRHTRK